MDVFFSYAREDRRKAETLAARLGQLGHQTWLDRQLSGGQVWWDEVLRAISRADVVVLALSRASLDSQACRAERWWAGALDRPLLPVIVERFPADALPPELAQIQLVDYVDGGEDAAFALARAMAHVRAAPPLPDPLPEPPPVPLSYLSDLARQLQASHLALEDQLAIVSRLETGLRSPDAEERGASDALLRRLMSRGDLSHEAYRRCGRLVAHESVGTAPTGAVRPAPAASRHPGPLVPGQPGIRAPSAGIPTWVKALVWTGGAGALLFIVFVILVLATLESGTCYDEFNNPYSC